MLAVLEEMKVVPGQYLTSFLESTAAVDPPAYCTVELKTTREWRNPEAVDQRQQFARDRDAIINAIQENIRARFPDLDLLDAMQVNTSGSLVTLVPWNILIIFQWLMHMMIRASPPKEACKLYCSCFIPSFHCFRSLNHLLTLIQECISTCGARTI